MFGSGKLAEVPSLVKDLASENATVLLVVDARPGAADAITKLLDEAGMVGVENAQDKPSPIILLMVHCCSAWFLLEIRDL